MDAREARLARAAAALDRIKKNPTTSKLPKDAVSLIREMRDAE
jgi:hypothetical protein